MMRPVLILIFSCLIALVSGSIVVSNEVTRVRDEIRTTREAIKGDRRDIHVLNAEWSYLNQPARVNDMAAKYLQLEPVSSEQVVEIEAIPFRSVVLNHEAEPESMKPYKLTQR